MQGCTLRFAKQNNAELNRTKTNTKDKKRFLYWILACGRQGRKKQKFAFILFRGVICPMITQDRLWKGIIEDLFEDFLHYFRPHLAQNEVDFSKGFEFMDKDLDILKPESEPPVVLSLQLRTSNRCEFATRVLRKQNNCRAKAVLKPIQKTGLFFVLGFVWRVGKVVCFCRERVVILWRFSSAEKCFAFCGLQTRFY